MDYGALPPEINSGRMYAGPGAASMLAAAAAWNGLAAELESAAASYGSVISALTSGPWVGPSSTAMAAAAAPYVAWMDATAQQAGLAGTQALVAAGAYAAAFAMTVPPPEIAANRALLMTLTATNFFGQNTPAIAATETQYSEMWAQDAVAMYGYAANSAAATAPVTPFSAAPETTNLAADASTSAQTTGSSVGAGVQSALSQLISTLSTALQSLTSPASSSSGLSGILSGLLGESSSSSATGFLGGLSSSGFSLGSLAESYATIPGWFSMFIGESVLSPLIGAPMTNAFNAASPAAAAAGAAGGAAAAAGGAAAAESGAAGAGFAGDLSGLAGLGQAAEVGALSVPPSWGWAAGPAAMLGSVPLGIPAAAALPLDVGAGLGFPFLFPGLPPGAVQTTGGAGAGAAPAKYGSHLRVVARPPAAGYPAADPAVAASTPKYPQIPAGFPTNGNTPPGYQAAVIYLPTNGHAPTNHN